MPVLQLPGESRKDFHHRYLNSDEWQLKRSAAIERANGHCQLCAATTSLNVHHNTYERLGDEQDHDLVVLCGRCHTAFHVNIDGRIKDKEKVKRTPKRVNALPAFEHVSHLEKKREASIARHQSVISSLSLTGVMIPSELCT